MDDPREDLGEGGRGARPTPGLFLPRGAGGGASFRGPPPPRGETRRHGRGVVDPPAEMALVFQEYSRSLLPWLTVRGNIALPLRHKDLEKGERTRLVEESVEAVGLSGFIDRYPWEL